MSDVNVNLPKIEGTITVTSAEPDKPATPPPAGFDSKPWKDAVEQFRVVTKWMIGIYGSIGALVAAAVPFAAFTDVNPTSWGTVVWGAGAALGGVAVAIAAACLNLVPRTVYVNEIRAKRRFVRKRTLAHTLARHPQDVLPDGIPSVRALRDAIPQLQSQLSGADAAAKPTWKAALATHEEALEALLWYRRFEKARSTFWTALAGVVIGTLGTGVGVGLLLFGLDDKKQDAEIAQLNAEVAKMRAEQQQIEAQTAQLPADASAKYAAEVAKLEADVAKVNADIAKVNAEVSQLTDEPSDVDIARANAEIDKIRAEIEKLEAEATDILRP